MAGATPPAGASGTDGPAMTSEAATIAKMARSAAPVTDSRRRPPKPRALRGAAHRRLCGAVVQAIAVVDWIPRPARLTVRRQVQA